MEVAEVNYLYMYILYVTHYYTDMDATENFYKSHFYSYSLKLLSRPVQSLQHQTDSNKQDASGP